MTSQSANNKQWFSTPVRVNLLLLTNPHPHRLSMDQVPQPWSMNFTQFYFDFEMFHTQRRIILGLRSGLVISGRNTASTIPDCGSHEQVYLEAKSSNINTICIKDIYIHNNNYLRLSNVTKKLAVLSQKKTFFSLQILVCLLLNALSSREIKTKLSMCKMRYVICTTFLI